MVRTGFHGSDPRESVRSVVYSILISQPLQRRYSLNNTLNAPKSKRRSSVSQIQRKVERIIEPQPVVEGAGVRLKRSIGTKTLDYLDPFLLLDHFADTEPEDYEAGFPLHPHRGIETVTYMLRGVVDHRDSIGNSGSIGPGDVQWMTAGGGIMHEEMPRVSPEGIDGFQL